MANMTSQGKKVYIGLSGGVDSAVSAALLRRAGYDVTGIFIRVWQPDWIKCNWQEDRRDAMRVAAHLGISFLTIDLEREYKRDVIDYMIAEYKAGRTPNPDVMCNKSVKFGAFYDWAMKNGADFVATGHYARVKEENGKYKMLKGKDDNKDQTYFLWTLKSEQLAKVLFPIGELKKPEVRELAKKFRLPNADKKDSQGLCFIGKVDVKEFLLHYIEVKPGKVLDENGKMIGEHPGALFFTIGERHGFSIENKSPNDVPMYVVDKNIEQNTITVSPKKNSGQNNIVKLVSVNWINGNVPERGKKFSARTRYRQQLQDVIIKYAADDSAKIEFESIQEPVASGQSMVFYDGEECMGGGIIL